MRTFSRRIFAALPVAAVVTVLFGCGGGGTSAPEGLVPGQSSPSIVVSPSTSQIKAGGNISLTADPTGGGASAFLEVQWSVPSGAGTLQVLPQDLSAGMRSTAVYYAPATPGQYVITASLKNYPNVTAVATVVVGGN
jgi:hypothetical protein